MSRTTVGRSGRGVAAVAAVIALLLGNVAFPPAHGETRSLRLLPVPLVSQAHPWTCGPAALMAALVYFGVFDEPEARLDAELGATAEGGTRVSSIVAEARRFGLDAQAQTGMTFADLERELASGAVVIVAVQAWPDHAVPDWRTNWEDGHYVVVVGLSTERVYVMDPSVRTGYAYLPRGDFLARWHDYDTEGAQKTVYERLGIVIRGDAQLTRYPAEPTPVK
jgi:ABC-type bacteriocin/lantibiotic exporter with double-glycine peptidase domain